MPGTPWQRRSISGIIFKYSEDAITWASKYQTCVSLSTTNAEFVVASQASKEAVCLYRLFQDLCFVACVPFLQADNGRVIWLITNLESHNCIKHIHVHYKFVCEKFQNRELDIQHYDSECIVFIPHTLSKISVSKTSQINLDAWILDFCLRHLFCFVCVYSRYGFRRSVKYISVQVIYSL